MSIKSINILDDRRLFPTVMNIIEGSNKVDTAVYTLENYLVNGVDLSTYDWYVHLIGVTGIDEVKVETEIVDNKLQITFDLTEYVTRVGDTLTYQLAAKDNAGAVWYSAKGIILNSSSIQADDFIVANYPSILKQWENKIKEMGELIQNAYILMPYDNPTPLEERVAGRFYLQRLNDVDYQCVVEDYQGNIIIDDSSANKNLVNTGMITNCVLDAPRDYNIVFDTNKLILKKGSKLTFPAGVVDGVKKFTEMVINTDYTLSTVSSDSSLFLVFALPNATLDYHYYIRCYAQDTQPATTSGQTCYWYDITENLMKYFDGSTWTTNNASLPICMAQAQNGVILEWFNNYSSAGCMGDYAWIGKDVEVLMPNGFDENGRYKNIKYKTDKIELINLDSYSSDGVLFLTQDGLKAYTTFEKIDIKYNISSDRLTYVIEDNKYYDENKDEIIGLKISEFNSLSGILVATNKIEPPFQIARETDISFLNKEVAKKQDRDVYLNALGNISGSIVLETEKEYYGTFTGTTTFILPSGTYSYRKMITLYLRVNGTPVINWGTTYFKDSVVPTIITGLYYVKYIYEPNIQKWVCHVIPEGA